MRHVDRRTFLSGAALIGAGFALPGCTSLPPRGAPDVVVLGAGMAGLTAAHSLHRAGLDVIVLEARERVGGRIHTLADPAPHGVEIGAQMIHGSRAPTWELIREFGIETRPMTGWNRWFQKRDGSFLPPHSDLERRVRERLLEGYRNFRGGDVTLQDFLDRLGLEGVERELASEQAYTWSAEADEVSLEAALQDGAAWEVWADENYQVVGGYGVVAAGLARPLGDRIRLASVVKSIEWGDAGVRVAYERAGRLEALAARRVLVTLPTGVLQSGSIRFAPALPGWKRAAIDALPMGRVVVVPMLFEDRFWRERDAAWQSWSTEGGRVSFWDPHAPGVGMPALQCWSVGRASQMLSDLGREGGLEQVLSWLERAFPGVGARRRLRWWTLADWVRDPFSLGSYSYTKPGAAGRRAVLATPIGQRLYFAGEATAPAPHYQTVHGAYTSGRRAAREILAADGLDAFVPASAIAPGASGSTDRHKGV